MPRPLYHHNWIHTKEGCNRGHGSIDLNGAPDKEAGQLFFYIDEEEPISKSFFSSCYWVISINFAQMSTYKNVEFW